MVSHDRPRPEGTRHTKEKKLSQSEHNKLEHGSPTSLFSSITLTHPSVAHSFEAISSSNDVFFMSQYFWTLCVSLIDG